MSDFNKYNNGENGNKEAKNSFWDNIPSPYDTAPKNNSANLKSNPPLESNHKIPVSEQDASASPKEVTEPIADESTSRNEVIEPIADKSTSQNEAIESIADESTYQNEVIEPIADESTSQNEAIEPIVEKEDDLSSRDTGEKSSACGEVSQTDSDTINWDSQSGVYHGKPPVQDDFNKEGENNQNGNGFDGNYGNNQNGNGFGGNFGNNQNGNGFGGNYGNNQNGNGFGGNYGNNQNGNGYGGNYGNFQNGNGFGGNYGNNQNGNGFGGNYGNFQNGFGGNYGNNQNGNGFGGNYGNNQNGIPTVKKGKVIFWPLVCFMIALCTVVAVYLAKHYAGGVGNNGENGGLPSHEYTSSVIDHIEFEEPKNEIFTDKVELYNLAQKSCVTVICTVEKNVLGQPSMAYSMGSGFVVSEDGYIVTNSHVVEGAKSYKVRFYDGTEYNALLIGNDEDCDIAVVKIKSDKKLYPASIGDSDKVRVGDFSMAIGTPSSEELYGTMTFGIISGKDRALTVENDEGQVVRTLYMIQTDTTLNPGNSGGPLFNMYGQVIGINTMKLMDSYEGMGFAIPISGALPIINSLISTGKSDYADSSYVKGGAQIGISGLTLDENAKKTYGFSDSAPDGVLIKIIQKDSSAYKAGVSAYDVITEFNGTTVTTFEQLLDLIKKCNPKQKVTMKVYRENRNKKGEYLEYSFELNAVGE